MRKFLYFFSIIIGVLSVVAAMSSGNYSIDSTTIGSGGGIISSATYITNAVVGILSGEAASVAYVTEIGFFYGIMESNTGDLIMPQLEFVNPTPANDTTTINTSIKINVSIGEANLDEVNFTWDGVDYSMYDDSLVLMYNFDNVSALGENNTFVVDVSGYGNDGFVNGSNWTSSGNYGGAFDFDGVDDYIEIDSNGTGNFNYQTYSIEVWFRSDMDEAIQVQPIWSYDYTSHSGVYYAQHLRLGGGTTPEDEIFFGWNNGTEVRSISYNNAISNDLYGWHHVVGTYKSGEQKLYLDGKEVANDNNVGTISYYDQPVWVGKANFAGTFNGTIDGIRFWNRTIGPEEVKQHYYSNLNKYDTNKWLLFVNESYVEPGVSSHNYSVSAIDDSGNVGNTETRDLNVNFINPEVQFVNPTPINKTVTFNNYVEINLTLYDLNIENISYIWDVEEFYFSGDGSFNLPYNITSSVFNMTCTDYLDFYNRGNKSGYYVISPDGIINKKIYCDMVKDGGGWMLLDNFVSTLPYANDKYRAAIDGSNITNGTDITDAGYINNVPNIESAVYARHENYLQMFYSGATIGYIEKTLPTYADEVLVYWGNWYSGTTDHLIIGGVIVQTPAANEGGLIYQGNYNSGDLIRFEEGGIFWVSEIWVRAPSKSNGPDLKMINENNWKVDESKIDLALGNYSYSANLCDEGGNCNSTGVRLFTRWDDISPFVEFVNPTPANDTTTTNTSIEINVSIGEANLDEVNFAWNGTNYTMYDDSLVLMMNFDNVSALGENDTHVVDVSSGGNNGTVNGSSWTSSGKYGGAFDFDGVDDYVSVNDSDNLDIDSNSLTITAWIRPLDCVGTGDGRQTIVTKQAAYYLNLENDTCNPAFYWYDLVTSGYHTSNQPVATGEWSYVVATYDGLNDIVKIYVDGIMTKEVPGISGNGLENANPLRIGGYDSVNRNFNGSIDEVRIWNKSLSASEIQQMYYSNLNKYDTDKWLLYINQSYDEPVWNDVHNYSVSAVDLFGNYNFTEIRILNVLGNPYLINASMDLNFYSMYDDVIFNSIWNNTNEVKLVISSDRHFVNCDYNIQSGCLANSSLDLSSPTSALFKNVTAPTKWYAKVCADYGCSSRKKTYNWSQNTNLSKASASFYGEAASDYSGFSVSSAGDVNGDGYDDILIGATGAGIGGNTYLIFGEVDNYLNNVNLSSVESLFYGEATSDSSGFSVSSAGDVNGDGYDDILIGARFNDQGGSSSGKAYLILGKPIGWKSLNLSNANASFIGEATGDYLGNSVSSAGDVNGDGYDDILIGAPYNDQGGLQAGKAYLILGKPTGWSKNINVSNVNVSFIKNNETGLYHGISVSSAGDVNGDGYDDILIGAPYNNQGGSQSGKTYLILGKPTGWSKNINVSNPDMINASFIGESSGGRSGISLSSAGDVNGDGYDDILIGAYYASKTYLILGKSTDWSKDLNLSASDTSFYGESSSDSFGYSVSSAGDTNGDGYDDILIGAYGNGQGGLQAGKAYLILGKSTDWFRNVNASASAASFFGESSYAYSGFSVSSAGDTNGDGYDDLIISAYQNNDWGTDSGKTYLILSESNDTRQTAGVIDIDNIPPNVPIPNLVSFENTNLTNVNLNCSAIISDDRSNDLGVTVRWYRNGILNSTMFYNNSYANGTLVSSILNFGNTTKHDNWSCSMQVNQNLLFGGFGSSNNLTILNSLPLVTLTGPINNSATTDRTPNFNWTVYDADNDIITYEINITPYYGINPSVLDERYISGISSSNYTPIIDLKLLYDNGYHYEWKVRANDGDSDGAWSEIWRVNITALVGILLLNDEILFGNLGIGESNSTEGTGLNPFIVENNGTVVVNISVNASSLWDSVTVDSNKYQFKADNVSAEVGSFNLVSSIMSWFNVPLTGFVVGISELNYSDVTDSAEIDINLTVPMDENPGQKSSNIILLAELAE